MIEMRDKVNTYPYDHDLPSRAQLNKKGKHEVKRPSILRICTATTTSARAFRELPSHDDWEFQSSNWRPNMSVAMLWQQDAGSFGDFAVFLATCHISIHLADFSRISCRPVAKHSRSSTPCSWQQLSTPLDATARSHGSFWYSVSLHHDSRILSAAGCSAPWEFLHGTLLVSSWEKWQEV
jgi:hypothetical protein